MGYKIMYASFGEEKKMPKGRGSWNKVAALLLVAVLLLGAMTVKNKGLRWVKDYLLPGDPAVTAAALEDMVTDLREGDSLFDAVTAFCREIMAHGTKAAD